MTRALLTGYVGACTVLLLVVQGLSPLRMISAPPLLATSAVLVIGSVAWIVRVVRRQRAPDVAPWMALVRHPFLLPWSLGLPPMVVLLVVLGWHMPPVTWDAMTYHLARAAYWRQWGTLAPFPTNDFRQTVFPGNADVLQLITLLFAHTDTFVFVVQFTAYLIATVAVYGLGRQLTLAPLYALIGAGAFATMPEVVLQSTSAQNDLVAAAFTGCAVYFIIDGLQRTRVASLALSVVALGLGVGTKPTAFLIVPGVALGALALLWTWRGSALHLVPRPLPSRPQACCLPAW